AGSCEEDEHDEDGKGPLPATAWRRGRTSTERKHDAAEGTLDCPSARQGDRDPEPCAAPRTGKSMKGHEKAPRAYRCLEPPCQTRPSATSWRLASAPARRAG